MAGAGHCPACGKGDSFSDKYVGCDLCEKWFHKKCVYLQNVKDGDVEKINWMCNDCERDAIRCYREFGNLKKECEMLHKEVGVLKEENRSLMEKNKAYDSAKNCDVKESLSQLVVKGMALEQRMDELKDEIIASVLNLNINQNGQINGNHSQSGGNGYAGAVKKGKNLLIVKSTEKDSSVLNRKEELASALKDVPVVDTKFTDKGNIVLNFASETERRVAAEKITDKMKDTDLKLTRKLSPKIMICNVSKHEEKEEVLDYLIGKNSFLQNINGIGDMIEMILCKPASGGTTHYILKCSPEVREAIHRNGDVVCLKWARYNVRDRYHVLTCFHCQRHGHTEKYCKFKQNGDHAVCGKCSGDHMSKDCTVGSEQYKCVNCVRQSRQENNHSVNYRECESMRLEIEKIKAMTDHGY